MKKHKSIAKSGSVEHNASPLSGKKQWLFILLFVVLMASVVSVITQNNEFSISEFSVFLKNASVPWLIVTFFSMISFILLEAFALLALCHAFGFKLSLWSGYIYSASDIYFSSITPSATGGQPASAYFMIRDGMNGMMVTALLMANLYMYTLSIIIIGIVCFIFRFGVFLQYSLFSQILIVFGLALQVLLLIFFYMLLKKDRLLHRICNGALILLSKVKIIKNLEAKQNKLEVYMGRYKEYSHLLSGRSRAMGWCFAFNLLQRIAQISVTMFAFMATTGQSLARSIDLLFMQGYAVLGSNSIPIPGAMGVSDYLMIDGFGNLMEESQAVNLDLLSRAVSFYGCVLICGISTLIQYLIIKKRRKTT